MKKKILIIGLNPTWQKTLHFKSLKIGDINRAYKVADTASGKGINVAKAIQNWDGESTVFQFSGGVTGDEVKRSLNESNIQHCTIDSNISTRICTTCLCQYTNTMTELIEPTSKIPQTVSEELFNLISANIAKYQGVVISGTYPNGITEDFYVKVIQLANSLNIPVLLDSYKNVKKCLSENIEILKINKYELNEITGKNSIKEGLENLKKNNIKYVAITDEDKVAYLSDNSSIKKMKIPIINKVESPLGAGDTVSGVLMYEYINDTPISKAFNLALIAGSLSCKSANVADFNKEEVLRLC